MLHSVRRGLHLSLDGQLLATEVNPSAPQVTMVVASWHERNASGVQVAQTDPSHPKAQVS